MNNSFFSITTTQFISSSQMKMYNIVYWLYQNNKKILICSHPAFRRTFSNQLKWHDSIKKNFFVSIWKSRVSDTNKCRIFMQKKHNLFVFLAQNKIKCCIVFRQKNILFSVQTILFYLQIKYYLFCMGIDIMGRVWTLFLFWIFCFSLFSLVCMNVYIGFECG